MPRGDFGGKKVNFRNVADKTIGEVYGTDDLNPSELPKKIWKFIKRHELFQ